MVERAVGIAARMSPEALRMTLFVPLGLLAVLFGLTGALLAAVVVWVGPLTGAM